MEADETVTIGIRADTDGLERTLGNLSSRADRFGAAMSSALRGAVVGGRGLDDVMRGLALRISSIALDAALKPLAGLAGAAIGGLAERLGDGIGAGGAARVVPFAKGGVVRAPTFFPMGGATGLMGEAGAEAILPLRRGPDGSLGVAGPASGGGSSIVFNVTTPDAGSFRRSEAQIQAMLARAAQRGQRSL